MQDFICGGRYVLSGFALISRPGIRRYVCIPLAVNFCLFAVAIVLGAQQVERFISWLTASWAWTEWLAWLLWPLFGFIALVIVFFCFSMIANLIAAPFNGMLSAAVETCLTAGASHPPAHPAQLAAGLASEIIRAIRSEAGKCVYFISRAVLLLLLFLIPVLGQTAAPLLWLLLAAWMLSLEYLDYPLGNRGKTFAEIRQIAASRRPLLMGFGSAVMSLTVIPVVNFIAMPVAVAAATRLSLENISGKPACQRVTPSHGREVN